MISMTEHKMGLRVDKMEMSGQTITILTKNMINTAKRLKRKWEECIKTYLKECRYNEIDIINGWNFRRAPVRLYK